MLLSLHRLFPTFLFPTLLLGSTQASAAAFGDGPPSSAAGFLRQVTAHFNSWDQDHNGVFSRAEVDTAMADPAIIGDEAAAIVTIKRAYRSKGFPRTPLTKPSLEALVRVKPAKGAPNLIEMYKSAVKRVPGDPRELFAAGAPKLKGVSQGKLGDCFCLAPLGAMLARNPREVAALFQRQPDNTYIVQIGHQSVIVAPPTAAEIALSASTGQTGMWLNLYEKAVGTARLQMAREATSSSATTASASAALSGKSSVPAPSLSPMDAVSRGGSAGTMLSMLTGHKIIRLSCSFAKSGKTTPTERDAKLGEIRRQLTLAQKEQRLMTTGTTRPRTPGITPNHAYAVLGYEVKSDTITLWNPHGDSFTPKGPAGLEYGYPKKAGVFSLPLTEFVTQFAGLAFETPEIALPSDPIPPPQDSSSLSGN